MVDVIDSSFQYIDMTNLVPSFFEWLFGGALGFSNGSLFGVAFLLAVALMTLLVFKGEGNAKGMATSSFITVICGYLFMKVGWINEVVFTASIIYFGYGLYYLWSHMSEYES